MRFPPTVSPPTPSPPPPSSDVVSGAAPASLRWRTPALPFARGLAAWRSWRALADASGGVEVAFGDVRSRRCG